MSTDKTSKASHLGGIGVFIVGMAAMALLVAMSGIFVFNRTFGPQAQLLAQTGHRSRSCTGQFYAALRSLGSRLCGRPCGQSRGERFCFARRD